MSIHASRGLFEWNWVPLEASLRGSIAQVLLTRFLSACKDGGNRELRVIINGLGFRA